MSIAYRDIIRLQRIETSRVPHEEYFPTNKKRTLSPLADDLFIHIPYILGIQCSFFHATLQVRSAAKVCPVRVVWICQVINQPPACSRVLFNRGFTDIVVTNEGSTCSQIESFRSQWSTLHMEVGRGKGHNIVQAGSRRLPTAEARVQS
jgi:hypothetical protein